MPSWLILLLCAVAAVGLFVLGMSLTLMIKGHHIDSEISTNKEMQRRGIKCAVQETREAMQQADCSDTSGFCSGNCAGCDVEHEQKYRSARTKRFRSAESPLRGFRRCGILLFPDTDAAGSENR